ncbi:MAG: DUF349 domain-containing protein [bacterium]|nr:DUF349 domain-containing protein [bacterium]
MLSRLFSSVPKWQSPKAQKRIEALAELKPGNEKDAWVLLKLAREDGEPAVRRAAVKYLHDFDVITQIQKRDLDASVREAAAGRLHDLLAGKDGTALPLAQRLEHIQRITTPVTLVHLIREGDVVEVRLAAIAQLQDEMYLDDIVRHSSVARLRQAAAERITTPKILEALAEVSRQKDKNVYKAIRARLDHISQGEKQQQLQQEKREALCRAMEAHSRAALNPLYAAKASSLRQQWQDLDAEPAPVELSERFETAFAIAFAQVSEIAAREQREADETQAREEMQESVSTLETTLGEYQGQEDFDLPSLAALRKTQRLRWDLAAQLQTPPGDLAKRYEKASHALDGLEQLLSQWQQDKAVIETTVAALDTLGAEDKALSLQTLKETVAGYQAFALPLPALLQDVITLTGSVAVTAKEKAPSPAAQDKQAARETLQTLLATLTATVDAGNSRDAARQLRKTQEFAREHHVQDARLAELAERVHELKSWAGFAVQPKKEALIAQMQALIEREMEPDDKADAIHALQESWKALGVADSAVEQPLWETFKAAGDKAFEPCRVHFAAQRELRQQNLQKRLTLCEQLESYQAALPAVMDWKNHDSIVRTARREWQSLMPVDRQKNQPVQERFNKVLQMLEDLLHEEQKKHEAGKRALIATVQALADSADLRAACDQTKLLQQQWKGLGQANPKADRKLWDNFRTACDVVFARRDAEFKTRQDTRDAAVTEAGRLIAATENLGVTAGSESANSKTISAELAQLDEAFRALSLPREKSEALRQTFSAARQHIEHALRTRAGQEHLARRESTVSDWESGIALLRYDDAPLHTEKAETLMLDMEIMLGLPTPEAQQSARRERQIVLLQKKGLRSRAEDHQANALLKEFLKTGPLAEEAVAPLAARLRVVLEKTGS